MTLDDQGTIECINSATIDVFGYARDEIIGKNVKMLMLPREPESGSDTSDAFALISATAIRFDREVFGQRRDGSTFPMEFATSEAVIDGRRYFTGIIRDLSGRWDEASFGRIIEDSLNEIFVFDAETWRFVQVNRGARNNLGYSLEELRKLTPLDIHPEMTRESLACRIHPLVTGEKSKIQFETIHKRKDGSCYFVEVHLHRAIYRGTSVLVAIILDITERRRAEELLRVRELACLKRPAAGS